MSPSVATPPVRVNPEIVVDIRNAAWSAVGFDVTGLCQRAAVEAFASIQGPAGDAEISIVLADDSFVRDLNKTWRNTDTPTNVLAFPCSGEETSVGAERLLGDVIVAYQTTRREAVELCLPLEHHVAHLIIHGVLHLFGYDHVDDGDAVRMEILEVKALARMGIGNPYEDDANSE